MPISEPVLEQATRKPAHVAPARAAVRDTDFRTAIERIVGAGRWQLIKWSLMFSALFWLAVYRLAESAEKLPEFVYVNF